VFSANRWPFFNPKACREKGAKERKVCLKDFIGCKIRHQTVLNKQKWKIHS